MGKFSVMLFTLAEYEEEVRSPFHRGRRGSNGCSSRRFSNPPEVTTCL